MDKCTKFKILQKRHVEVKMGPLNESQVAIYPNFHCTLVDCFGPLKCYCLGLEGVTKSGDRSVDDDLLL